MKDSCENSKQIINNSGFEPVPQFTDKLDKDFIEDFYNKMNSAWPTDYYNIYTRRFITEYVLCTFKNIESKSIVLNAGSGGTVYNIPGTMYHMDIAENRIKSLPNHFVGGIEEIPFEDSFFDYIICVGSVINYAEKTSKAFNEFRRILKPGGRLIVEYERIHSGLIPSKYWKNDRYLFFHEYFDKKHENYVYSDAFINGLLKETRFEVLEDSKFQTIVPLIAMFTENEGIMAKYIKYDYLFRKIPYLNSFSHNRIILCSKL